MATEYPPLGKSFVISYANNDRDYPIIGIRKDPRVENYKIPEDLSPHPDSKRYPNHVFTGAQATNSDERVQWIYEILPAPWVPFTRYDDDLGPIQGRRRSVKNEGQQASLTSSTKISYEGREGSSIVLSEIEESWSIAVDDDGNSLFPIKERDLYDDRFGPISEVRQLIVPTGEEKASLEYDEPIVTQTTYEPYNEYLQYKVVTSYVLDGPTRNQDVYDTTLGSIKRVSNTVYNDGLLKSSLSHEDGTITQITYEPINALVVDRIVETYSIDGPTRIQTIYDPALGSIKRTSRATLNSASNESSLTHNNGTITQITYEPINSLVVDKIIETYLVNGPTRIEEIYDPSRGSVRRVSNTVYNDGSQVSSLTNNSGVITQVSYKPINALVVDKTIETYSVNGPELIGNATNNDGQLVKVTRQRKASDNYTAPVTTAKKTVEVAREDAKSLIEVITEAPEVFDKKTISVTKPDVIPERFRASIPNTITSEVIEGTSIIAPTLSGAEFEKTIQRENVHTIRETKNSRSAEFSTAKLTGIDYEESFDLNIPFVERIATTIEDSSISADITPLGDGKYLVREYDKEEVEASLASFYESYPTRISLAMPKRLKSIKVKWDTSEIQGEQFQEMQASGAFTSVSIGDSGSCTASIKATPQFDINMEDINGANIFATAHMFFVRGPVTMAKILAKCGSTQQSPIQTWPVFKTQSYNLTAKGAAVDARVDASLQVSINANPFGIISQASRQFNKQRSIDNIIINIPPCIHETIVINPQTEKRVLNATPSVTLVTDLSILGIYPPLVQTYSKSIQETSNVGINLPATSPSDIPRTGKYLIESKIDPYKYGFFLVLATTIDASQFA